jgi:hypothetical protein
MSGTKDNADRPWLHNYSQVRHRAGRACGLE